MTKSDLHLTDKVSTLPFLIIGFVIGATLAILAHKNIFRVLPFLWPSSYGLFFLLAYPNAKSFIRLLLGTLVASFFATMPFVWPNMDNSGNIVFLAMVSGYAINSFHIAYQERGFKINYESLFFAVWDSFVKLLIGALFTGLCWLILEVWSGLFNLIGISFFNDLFSKPWFILWGLPFFGSIGLLIATQTKKVARNVRVIILTVCRFLLPVLSFIGIFFILSWLIGTLLLHQPINLKPHYFISFTLLTIIFINGVYQEGEQEKPYAKFILWIVNFFIILMPIFMLITLYGVIFSVSSDNTTFMPLYQPIAIIKSGLNSQNFGLLVNTLLLLAYSISYSITVFRRQKPWLKSLKGINFVLAILLILVTLILNNHWFNKASFNPGNIKPPQQYYKKIENNRRLNQYKTLQNRFQKSPINWSKNKTKAIVLGYNQDTPLILCRANIGGKNYAGTLSLKKCNVIKDKKVTASTNFSVLSGPSDQIKWSVWLNTYGDYKKYDFPVVIRIENQTIFFVCRVIYKNRIYIGTLNSSDSLCHFIDDDGKAQKSSALQNLYIKAKKTD